MDTPTAQWADFFPGIKCTQTEDPRIFETKWSKEPDKTKKKTFFACIVGVEGNNCYGVDVVKQWAVHSEPEEKAAIAKMKRACYYYQENGEWPKD